MKHLFGASLILLACACSPAPTTEAPEAPVTDVRVGSELELQPLVGAETRGRLTGELGCSFAVGSDVFLLAMGNVDRAALSEALVKANGEVVQLPAAEPGGYDGMVEGETFAGGGLSAEVRTIARNETGTEEVAYNATLLARDGAGGERAYEGTWSCGP